MSHAKKQPRKLPEVEAPADSVSSWLMRIALVLSLALVLTRATMLEVVRQAFAVAPGADPVPRAPGPATSLVLDLLAWVPALLVLASRKSQPHIFSATTLLFILLGGWAVLSMSWADEKFAAVVSGFHLLSAGVFLWSCAQLVRSWRRLRIVAGVCLGLLLIYGAQSFNYQYVERAEMRRDWEQNRERHLRSQGLDPDSFEARQFEAKLLRGEMMGFNASPNSFAAVTVLLLVVVVGIVIQRITDKDALGWIAPAVLGIVFGAMIIYWCISKTAYVTPVIAGAILAVLAAQHELIARRAKTLYFAGLLCVILGIAAVVGHGLVHGSLVIDSMTFRWRYWVGAIHVIVKHSLLGVGYDNFGQHYLAARLLIAAEEIRDPHNFLIRFLAELGIFGGVLAITWQAKFWWDLTQHPLTQPPTKSTIRWSALTSSTGIALAAFALSVLSNVDFGFLSVGGDAGAAIVTLGLLKCLAGGVLVLAGVWMTGASSLTDPFLNDRSAPWIFYAILVGLAVFMLHNLVDFSLFEVGPLFLFTLLAGSALGMRDGVQQHVTAKTRIVALSSLSIIWLIALVALVVPVLIAADKSNEADERLRQGSFTGAARLYREAAAAVPYNAEHSFDAANAALRAADFESARQGFDQAIRANPGNAGYRFSRGAMEASRPAPNIARVRDDYDRGLEIDPANVSQRLEYARVLEKLSQFAEARRQYETALRFNDQLPPDEVKRLDPSKVAEIQSRIASLAM